MNDTMPKAATATAMPRPIDITLMRDTVALCAFAIEARRVLDEVGILCDHLPNVQGVLHARIEYMNQYSEMAFPVAEVLSGVCDKLDKLADWAGDVVEVASHE